MKAKRVEIFFSFDRDCTWLKFIRPQWWV